MRRTGAAMPKDSDQKVVNLAGIKVACNNCALHQICLPIGLDRRDLEKLEEIIRRQRPLKRGEHLFRQDDEFHAVYAVRSGSLKTYTLTSDGNEQISGFYLPGELVGLDAIGLGRHPSSAKVLETASFCEIPFDQLEELSGILPSLRHQLLGLMSKEIFCDETMLMVLGKNSAESRLASFLLNLSSRFRDRGFSPAEFRLHMSRNDIGNYLGLAVETVSRLFTRFQEQGLLEAKGKHIRLHDLEALRQMAKLPDKVPPRRGFGAG